MESNHKSAFTPLDLSEEDSLNGLLEHQAREQLDSCERVQTNVHSSSLSCFPSFLKLVLSIFASLVRNCASVSNSGKLQILEHPFTAHIRTSLLKLIAEIIQKRLYTTYDSQKYFDEISYSLLFKNCLLPLLITLISENSNFVYIEKFANFYRSLMSDQYMLHVPLQLYYLYGGGVFTMSSKTFRERFVEIILSVGSTLSSAESLMTRNVDQFRKNKERNEVVEQSIKLVCLSKNKQVLQSTADALTLSIFADRTHLSKDEFESIMRGRSIEPIMLTVVNILRAECKLVEEISFRSSVAGRIQASQTNFYAMEMQKILSKCPFNGDEKCGCKKCQCVRRNRQSAKINQERKRNAMIQVEPMKKRIEELEQANTDLRTTNIILQEENMVLKGLLLQLKGNPALKNYLMQSLQPLSKILND